LVSKPQGFESAVVDEDLRSVGGVGAVLEIIAAAVPEQRRFVGIEEDGGEGVVGVSFDEDAGFRLSEGVGERLGLDPGNSLDCRRQGAENFLPCPSPSPQSEER